MIREMLEFLKTNDVEYKECYDLAMLSPIKIGGKASIVVFPDSINKLICLVDFLECIKICYKIVGRMSNVLFCDEIYDGVVIRTDRVRQYEIKDNIVSADCGVSMPHLAHVCSRVGLSGMESLCGIPGSIAGAVVGNAGAFGSEISDIFISALTYDKGTRRIVRLFRDELGFSYRRSFIKDKGQLVILSCDLCLRMSDIVSVTNETERIRKIRKDTQPTDLPSLGSSFRRPDDGTPAARLIDLCGLKGCSVGGCSVSEKHAGFIVNTGGGRAEEYIELTEKIKGEVYRKFKVSLEAEVESIKT